MQLNPKNIVRAKVGEESGHEKGLEEKREPMLQLLLPKKAIPGGSLGGSSFV